MTCVGWLSKEHQEPRYCGQGLLWGHEIAIMPNHLGQRTTITCEEIA